MQRRPIALSILALLSACATTGGAVASSQVTHASKARFGNPTAGEMRSVLARDTKRVSSFTLSRRASVQSISVFLDGRGKGAGRSQLVRFVAFADAGGVPGARLTVTRSTTISKRSRGHWVTLPVKPALKLAPGAYYLGLQSGKSGHVARVGATAAPDGTRQNSDTYPGGPANRFGRAGVKRHAAERLCDLCAGRCGRTACTGPAFAAGEHRAADDLRHCRGRQASSRSAPGVVDGRSDRLCLRVAPLRRERRVSCNPILGAAGPTYQGGPGRPGHDAAGRRHSQQRRRRQPAQRALGRVGAATAGGCLDGSVHERVLRQHDAQRLARHSPAAIRPSRSTGASARREPGSQRTRFRPASLDSSPSLGWYVHVRHHERRRRPAVRRRRAADRQVVRAAPQAATPRRARCRPAHTR